MVKIIIISFIIISIFTNIIILLDKYSRFNKKYNSKLYGNTVKLKFSMVQNLYRVNPKKWRYEKIFYNSDSKLLLYNSESDNWPTKRSFFGDYSYENRNKIIRIRLSFIDYLKFLWCIKHSSNDSEGLELITSSVQKDINILKKEADKQIKQANEIMNTIKENLDDDIKLEL